MTSRTQYGHTVHRGPYSHDEKPQQLPQPPDPNYMKGKWWRRLPDGGWQVNTTGEPEW